MDEIWRIARSSLLKSYFKTIRSCMPKHEFLLKKTKENIFSKGHSVVISDDLILHISYSLEWVQTTGTMR